MVWMGGQPKNQLNDQAQRVAVSRTCSTRRLVRRHQESDLGSVPFDVFVHDLEEAVECLHVKTSPNWEDQLILGRAAILKDQDGLEEQAGRNLTIQGGDYHPQLSTH